MPQIGLASIARFAPTLKITFSDDPKRSDGRDRSAVLAVEFVALIAIQNDFAVDPARQLEAVNEDVSWIEVTASAVAITVAKVPLNVPVTLESWHSIQCHPSGLDVADVVIPITVAWIEVHSGVSDVETLSPSNQQRLIIGSWRSARNSRSDDVGWCEVASVPGDGHHARKHRAVLSAVNALRFAPPAARLRH